VKLLAHSSRVVVQVAHRICRSLPRKPQAVVREGRLRCGFNGCLPLAMKRLGNPVGKERPTSGLGLISIIVLAIGLAFSGGCLPSGDSTRPLPNGSVNKSAEASAPEFRDITSESGLAFTYLNGEEAGQNAILESLGAGVGMLDFDRDGLLDLFFPGGGGFGPGPSVKGASSRLFRQADRVHFVEVSQQAGIDSASQYTHGVAVGDFDNDGFADVLVTGYGRLTLWHNGGDGTFLDVTQPCDLLDHQWSSSAGWGDVNGDGALDVYLAHYANWSFENHPQCGSTKQFDVCPPRRFEGLDDALFLSDGAGAFSDVWVSSSPTSTTIVISTSTSRMTRTTTGST
jgi:FG-GAP-like repeat